MATYSIRQLTKTDLTIIEPCVTCDTIKYLQMLKPTIETWQVKCMDCFMTGPKMESRVAAIESWNRIFNK